MQIIADLHLHSKYSRATSPQMNIHDLERFAAIKGLNLLGTGDFTHPLHLKDLKNDLSEKDQSGFFVTKNSQGVLFALSAEIALIYSDGEKVRKVHNVILAPSFEVVEQINDELGKRGNLSADGRPIFGKITCADFMEMMMKISKDIMVIPAHAWTPWFSVFGSKSGFDSLQECFKDQTKNIFAIETGLSSNPEMNWRLSQLDNVALVSNSDAHSPWSWRLGREANVFNLEKVAYEEMTRAIKTKDKNKFLYTIETDPNYGKYHLDGHRDCNVSLTPDESKKLNEICPKCKRPLTIGVLNRVEQLADRKEGFVPKDAIPFKTLLPLYEIISNVMGISQLYSQKVMAEHDKIVGKFGSELNVLLNATLEELKTVTSEKIADAVIKVREGKVRYVPGYDGVYGVPIFDESRMEKQRAKTEQRDLEDFLK